MSIDFDELHMIVGALVKVEDTDGIIKTVRDLLKGAYEQAVLEMEDEFEFLFFYDKPMEDALNLKIEDKSWDERIREYTSFQTPGGGISPEEGVQRVVETEYHRMYNTGAYDSAKALEKQGKAVYKRWSTMNDDKVRSTHSYLEGDSVPLDEPFYTYDGDSAMFPGGFTMASNNCGCRCSLEYEAY